MSKNIQPSYLLILKNPQGCYFLSGKYFMLNEKLPEIIQKRYKDATFVKVAEWTKEVFE